jgi:hypothetical protein
MLRLFGDAVHPRLALSYGTPSASYISIEKSKGVKSVDLGGHEIGSPLPDPFAWKLIIEKGFHFVGIRETGRTREENRKRSVSFSEVSMFLSVVTLRNIKCSH